MSITDIICSAPVETLPGEWLQRWPAGRLDGDRVLIPSGDSEISIPAGRCTWRQSAPVPPKPPAATAAPVRRTR